jgi:colicin import membrane protein
MTLSPFYSDRGPWKEGLWVKMVSISLGLHLLIFAFFLNIFPQGKTANNLEPAYVVDLVSLPGGGSSGNKISEPASPSPSESPPASKEIRTPKKEAVKIAKEPEVSKPVPIPKRTPEKSVKEDSSKELDLALERIKKKVQQDKSLENKLNRLETKVQGQQGLEKALARLENKRHSSGPGGSGTAPAGSGAIASSVPGGQEGVGIQFQLYNASLRSQIKRNWGLPEELMKRQDISAEILIRISRNGHIEDTRFQRKSGVEAFDQEVLRTLKKSDPLPPLPDGYPRGSYDVILTFHSKELSGR